MRASWLRWAIPAAVVPVLMLLAYGFKTNPREIPSPLLDRPAADFTLTTFAGAPLSLESLRGKVVMLNFWASWCRPACYEEAPALERTWREYKDKGVMVVGVDFRIEIWDTSRWREQDDAGQHDIASAEGLEDVF